MDGHTPLSPYSDNTRVLISEGGVCFAFLLFFLEKEVSFFLVGKKRKSFVETSLPPPPPLPPITRTIPALHRHTISI